ncbi:MAG: Holliday junction resolvase RuvX [Thalassolituus sp.]|nr:MAG: Holliday junction resolvase RuvX [Thalassolituus sp.]
MPETTQIPQRIASVMGFDFGTRRIGIAIGQRLIGSATALSPIKARDGVPDWEQLEKVIEEWQPDAFVTGLPLNMDGTPSEMSRRAAKFARRLEGRFHRPSYTHDERLTSYEAKRQVMEESGYQNFGDYSVDGLAACLILESWMSEPPKAGENE